MSRDVKQKARILFKKDRKPVGFSNNNAKKRYYPGTNTDKKRNRPEDRHYRTKDVWVRRPHAGDLEAKSFTPGLHAAASRLYACASITGARASGRNPCAPVTKARVSGLHPCALIAEAPKSCLHPCASIAEARKSSLHPGASIAKARGFGLHPCAPIAKVREFGLHPCASMAGAPSSGSNPSILTVDVP